MTTAEKVARRKLSLLQLAQELNSVSKACKVMGYSRQHFYEIRRNFQTYGADGLIDRLPGARAPHPNRLPQEIEDAILAHSLDQPTHGALRVSQELSLKGVQVSSKGVNGRNCDCPKSNTRSIYTRQVVLARFEQIHIDSCYHLKK